jgi:hypothetical protein
MNVGALWIDVRFGSGRSAHFSFFVHDQYLNNHDQHDTTTTARSRADCIG